MRAGETSVRGLSIRDKPLANLTPSLPKYSHGRAQRGTSCRANDEGMLTAEKFEQIRTFCSFLFTP